MRVLFLSWFIFITTACQPGSSGQETGEQEDSSKLSIGSIERFDQRIDTLIPLGTVIEILSKDHEWTEGPLWVESEKMVLFSDIPRNCVYQWKEGEGSRIYLKNSGYTGKTDRGGESGSNGLLIDPQGKLVLCQHGDRRIARMSRDLNRPRPRYETVVSHFNGMKFNSPNDAVYNSVGDLYFTDPPYGLEGNVDDPAKEIPFQGVYRLKAGATEPELLIDSLTRPNGLAFSPNEETLYLANSDPSKAYWVAYNLEDGQLMNGNIFYNATDRVGEEKGLPDGMKVHSSGAIFATGPGGVWIFNGEGQALGRIKTGEATSNCTFDDREENLYITADMYLLRVKMK